MARADRRRIEVKGTLRAVTPLLVGGTREPGLDVVPLRDGAGRLVVPASSLTGVLRHHATRHLRADAMTIAQLFGTSDVGASRLVVRELRATGTPSQTLRDGVGIDRRHGVAAENVKFDRVQLDAGTDFELFVSYDTAAKADDEDPAKALFDQLVDDLLRGELRVGAGTTRGQGRVHLVDAMRRTIDLCDAQSVLAVLGGGSHTWERIEAPEQAPSRGLTVVIEWRAVTPVISAVRVNDGAVDHAPMVLARVGDGTTRAALHMVLPGTSIKGVMRSEVERMVRTLCDEDAPEGFLEQLAHPLVVALFGGVDRRSALWVDDVLSEPVLTGVDEAGLLDDWHAMLAARGDDSTRLKRLRDALDLRRQGLPGVLIPTSHVAVDRWTGGPVDGALYSVLEPHGIGWEPMVLRVDVDAVDPNLGTEAALALLVLVLDAVTAGEVGFGFGTHRGLGSVAVDRLSSSSDREDRVVAAVVTALNSYKAGVRLLDTLDDHLRSDLAEALTGAVDRHRISLAEGRAS